MISDAIGSYAQNFEDVILWRALKHVPNGFYVDIGAQDPVVDSVSLAFYEKGWRGVHVEPVARYAQMLREARPDELVIEAAVSQRKSSIQFTEILDTGLSTGDPRIAEIHAAKGFNVESKTVACIPLAEIFDNCGSKEIHWLKIDVEGMEQDVIRSWLPSKVRPWIVVVESTLPNSQEESFQEWESILVDLGYGFVYFDGLNRFYVSEGHTELKGAFGAGPNFFDNFELRGAASSPFCRQLNSEISRLQAALVTSKDQLKQGRVEIGSLRDQLVRSANQLAENDEEVRDLRKQFVENERLFARRHAEEAKRVAALESMLVTIRNSTSWRITKPLRLSVRVGRWLISAACAWVTFKPGSRPRRTARSVVGRSARLISRVPLLADISRRCIGRFPFIADRLRPIAQAYGFRRGKAGAHYQPVGTRNSFRIERGLSPRAQRIYRDLNGAISSLNKGN